MELLDSRVELLDVRADVVSDGHALLDAATGEVVGTDTFAEYVERHGAQLVRLAAAVLPDPAPAGRIVVSALATAFRDWGELTEAGRDPHVAVVRQVCRRLPRQDEEDWTTRPRPGGSPTRDALWRMMPRDRLAGALDHMLGLDEREIAVAMRTRWLDAVAPLARSRVRGPELLAAAGVGVPYPEALDLIADEVPPVPRLAERARHKAKVRRVLAVGGTVLAAAALAGSAVAASAAGSGSSSAPAPVAATPVAQSLDQLPLWQQYVLGLRGACPEPADVGPGSRYGEPPLPASVMLSPLDLGPGWVSVRRPRASSCPYVWCPATSPSRRPTRARP